MRLSLIALIPLTAFCSAVHAHTHEAREHIDELATRAFKNSLITTRQDLADLSTRDLLNELEDRLQRRKNRWVCVICGNPYFTLQSAEAHVKTSPTHKKGKWTLNGNHWNPPWPPYDPTKDKGEFWT
ncbi:hypothetical protein D9611_012278 [Ephemerocybe angulata]|uniref:C2H2-type domain-containing protein n=1 Tax=Ephemerocybe angulata TaxID=980116 RepID=A0A8H5ES92_9AGAR|nr:hypothetical protein D9611_012278 [Tulosesus angulatus]